MTAAQIRSELAYLLEYEPDNDMIAEAEEWMLEHPGVNLAEYVDAMREIGAL